jgi:hypothetical protein
MDMRTFLVLWLITLILVIYGLWSYSVGFQMGKAEGPCKSALSSAYCSAADGMRELGAGKNHTESLWLHGDSS